MSDFAIEMFFDEKAPSKKSTKTIFLKRLLKPLGILVSASGVSSSHKRRFSPSDPNESCDRLKILLQEKQAGNNGKIIDEGNVAKVDKLLEYNCIYTKQHKLLVLKCLS